MVAIVSGIGPGLGASLCRLLCTSGIPAAGIARSAKFGKELENELTGKGYLFQSYVCDVRDEDAVHNTISDIRSDLGDVSTLIHNAGAVTIAPFLETTSEDFLNLWEINCLGAVNTTRAVLPGMLKRKRGNLLFTGATAALRGSANFSAFAASKFALRGFVQSLAREFGPKGIHATHVVIDGLIWGPVTKERFGVSKESCLHPDDIARQYLNLINQERSAWTQELDLRPYSEAF